MKRKPGTCLDMNLEDSLAGMGRWVDAKLCAIPGKESDAYELEVLSAWGRVQKNRRYGRQFQIGGKRYERGLHCHAPASIRVKPKAASTAVKSFRAVVGIDDALQWNVRDYQSGPIWPKAVIVLEDLEGVEFYRSEVFSNSNALEIDVPLNGIEGFILKISGIKKETESLYTDPPVEEMTDRDAIPGEIHDWCDVDIAGAKLVYADGNERYLDEMTMTMSIAGDSSEIPFEFTYGSRSFRESIKDWKVGRSGVKSGTGRESYDISYIEEKTGLEVTCRVARYLDYPAVEWTLYFKNNGRINTPVISGIKALDTGLARGEGVEYLLHYNIGGVCRSDDFRPVEETLPPGVEKHFRCVVGYSSDPYMPYFNIEDGSGEGIIAAIGWPGQWTAGFVRQGEKGLRISAGQETTHFYLEPGEEVRSPLIVLMMWRGDRTDSQNLWRRWMVEYGLPLTADGKPPEPIIAAGNTDLFRNMVTEDNQLQAIKRYVELDMGINTWWMDLGWHTFSWDDKKLAVEAEWVPDPSRFPNGLKPVTDYAGEHGIKTIAWFCPECMNFGGHTEWLIWGSMHEPLGQGDRMRVFDLGNSDALNYLIDRIDKTIRDEGVGVFRIDGGWGMLPVWEANDKPDRAGITEIRYVTGYLKLFDELLKRNPGLLIDNCCRGGRRLDIESSRRTVPLHRTDCVGNALANQCHTYGLSQWLPYSGSIVNNDVYYFRSNIVPSVVMVFDMTDMGLDHGPMRRLVEQYRSVCGDLYGDYYPLTPYSCEDYGWFALQFNSPEKGTGFTVVIRRSQNSPGIAESDTMAFKFKGLDRNAKYIVKDMDSGDEKEYSGEELYVKGLPVTAPLHTALLYSYKKK